MLDDELFLIHNGGGLSLCDHDECPLLAINAQDDTSRKFIPIELFFASDILLYAIALGKEGGAGWWCTYCKLHERGDFCTINYIALRSKGIGYLSQARDRMGVDKTPFSDQFLSHIILHPSYTSIFERGIIVSNI